MTEPIYTAENVIPAYQLIYSFTIFWRTAPGTDSWLEELKGLMESDGIRILAHRFRDVRTSLFLISTKPDVRPVRIPTRIKGRLQHLLKDRLRQPFQRNYDLSSIGSTSGQKTEDYVAGQVEHHADDCEDLRADFTDLQMKNPDVDLLKPRFHRRARCTCNLHLVLVHRNRHRVLNVDLWVRIRQMLRKWAAAKRLLLSTAGLLPDHMHLTFGLSPELSPLEASLSLMNNVAWVHGIQPVLMDSFRVSTFGRYDLGAIRQQMGMDD